MRFADSCSVYTPTVMFYVMANILVSIVSSRADYNQKENSVISKVQKSKHI